MFVIVLAMAVIVVAAAVLVAVMAYPNRGREVPNAPVVNETLHTVAGWLGLDNVDRDLVSSASSRQSESTERRG